MKATTLVVMLADGAYKSVAGPVCGAILDLAVQVRDSGQFEGQPVISGIVQSSERPFPVMRFRVRSDSVVPVAKKAKAKK